MLFSIFVVAIVLCVVLETYETTEVCVTGNFYLETLTLVRPNVSATARRPQTHNPCQHHRLKEVA